MTLGTERDVFGAVVCAMVTPFTSEEKLDLDGAQQLAAHLVDAGCDGLVISGTTGESATTTDEEKSSLLRAVVDAVGERAKITAGVGTNNTHHSVVLAHQAQEAGAHALLAVTPYYNKPPQAGLLKHFSAIADATDLPVMLYDIPGRSALALASETIAELAGHPKIIAVKDATGDLAAAAAHIATTDVAYYSGDDALNLPFLSVGAEGFVSVAAHLVAPELRRMFDAYHAGDVRRACQIHQELLPVYSGIFSTQGVMTIKAVLNAEKLPAGPTRLPLVDATADQRETLRDALAVVQRRRS